MRERKSKLRLAFDVELFDKVATALDLATDADRARWLDVDPATWHRVSRRINMPSNPFMAAVRTAMSALSADADAMAKLAAQGITAPTGDELFPLEPADQPMPDEDLSPVFTRPEAAAYLKVGLTTLDALIKRGGLIGIKVGGSVRVRRRDADAYLDSLQPAHERELQPA